MAHAGLTATDFSRALGGEPAALAVGKVMHARMRPVAHRFAYRVFCLMIDLERLDEADGRSAFFSVDRFNLASFHQRDHGPADGTSLRTYLGTVLAEAGHDATGWRILLLCYPRILGYVFDPLSVYYCYDAAGELRALVYEVRNTFGERHSYVAPIEPGERSAAGIRQERDKLFYVSPFIGMNRRYRFRVGLPAAEVKLRILAADGQGPEFAAAFSGRRRALSGRNLVRQCIALPFLTLKVVAAIHFEALRLWLKGAPLVRRPPPPPRHSFPRQLAEAGPAAKDDR